MKRRALCFAAMLTVPLAAFAQTPTFTPAERAEGQADVKSAAKLLSDKLKDPTSAKFRNTFMQKTIGTDGQEHITLCGEINAKNSYGGMNGFHKFILVGDQVLIGGSGDFMDADKLCDSGHPVLDTKDLTLDLRKAFDANAVR